MKLKGGGVILTYYIVGLLTVPILIWNESIAHWLHVEVKTLLSVLMLIYVLGIGLILVLSVKWDYMPDWVKARYILATIGAIMLVLYLVGIIFS